ncbi:hypothetical protein [Bradyrhizobium sp. BR 1433]|uniref:hypothetical protein n=1 Tax=Bradyrhizobium sp. BR 1433 TaxID=3447967 RepID=UPI003EE6FC9B
MAVPATIRWSPAPARRTLIGGDGKDSFVGSDTGTASMVGGSGQDYFYLNNATSSDTIDGGGGNKDSLTFLDHASTDVSDISSGSNGSMDITFSNGQVTQISNIEYLIFNDGNSTKL